MTSFARGAAAALAVGGVFAAASCQLVAGIEPWTATGSGGATTTSSSADSTTGGCTCATNCFGAPCGCGGCEPREVTPPGKPTCNDGAARCLGVASEHLMLVTDATVGNAVTLLPKDPGATFQTVLSGVGVRDVAAFAGAGYALGLTGLYKGGFADPWPEKAILQLTGAPEYLRVLRFGEAEILAYADQSDGSPPAGLYSINEAQMSVNNELNSTYVGVTTDGTNGFAVVAGTSTSSLTRFPMDYKSAMLDVEVPGNVVDLTGGGGHLFAALENGDVLARDTAMPTYDLAPASTAFMKTTRIRWTPKWVYGADSAGHIYRFAPQAPYAVDDAFTRDTAEIVDLAADAQGVYWVTTDSKVYMLSAENE